MYHTVSTRLSTRFMVKKIHLLKHLLLNQKVLNNPLFRNGMPESSWTVALPVYVLINYRHHICVQRAR